MNNKSGTLFLYGVTNKTSLTRLFRILCVSNVAALVFSILGCAGSSSISDSSNSISNSFSSSSKSSKSSSEERKEAYKGDVRYYTEAYVRSNSNVTGFKRGLSSVGKNHGITNWEADIATYVGIGEGFAKAGISQDRINAYMANLTQGNPVKINAIRKGLGQEL